MLTRIVNYRISVLALLLAMLLTAVQAVAGNLAQRADVQDFIAEMVDKHGFSQQHLQQVFSQASIRSKIIEAISRPAESKPWYEYRPIFLTNKRIRKGVDFIRRHQKPLQRAEAEYGVPPEIITAIIGVESFYGQHKGGYRVIDALSTLAFDYPKRSDFFRSELESFLLMAREEKRDPLTFMGSYAGAMGQPQFISSSFRSYAVDFDGDGHRDLWNNADDIIGSVANYFKRHGWEKGAPIASRATVTGNEFRALLDKGLKPHTSLAKLQQKGITIHDAFDGQQKAALIELTRKNSKEYWVGLQNFYVITRYNHSELYAMAVYQLSREILNSSQHPS